MFHTNQLVTPFFCRLQVHTHAHTFTHNTCGVFDPLSLDCDLAWSMPTRENYPRTHSLTATKHTLHASRASPHFTPAQCTNDITREDAIWYFRTFRFTSAAVSSMKMAESVTGDQARGWGGTPPGKGWMGQGGGVKVSKGDFPPFRSSWTDKD